MLASVFFTHGLLAAPIKGGSANLAMVGDPQNLDPMAATTDLVGTIMQHVYETLYTFDANWRITPMLAKALPRVSNGGLLYSFVIRDGVVLHNGRELTAEDVVASLQRWMEMAPRGKALASQTDRLEVKGKYSFDWRVKVVNASLLAHLALPSGMAAIMAKESLANPLTEYVGTGPYKFKERRPDQFVWLVRHDSYSARTESPSGYAGKREALLDDLRFIPVPNSNTRLEGILSGQFHFSDQLNVNGISRLERGFDKITPLISPNYGFPYLVFNTKEGVMASMALRQAVQTALGTGEMLEAGFGDKRFYSVEGAHFPKNSPYYSTIGTELYNQKKPKLAKAAALAAGYKEEPIRILTSRQYEFHHTMVLVMAEQLKEAGFKTDVQVVDWATLIQRRGDAKLWDIYMTHSGLLPEPMLSPPQLSEGAPGWWSSPEKSKVLASFNAATDPVIRATLWEPVQQLVYNQVPYIHVGKFSGLSARSNQLQGYQPAIWPFFWNSGLAR
ncbi:MAG: ABC transporter substrate-binding protein [Gammaproteobacteria bacterium]|nr:ABC transporter substrate-binding protein [Gammaproteobacteria bacterium]